MQPTINNQITLLYKIETDYGQDFLLDKICFFNKNTSQFFNSFYNQPMVQVKGLFGCLQNIERKIQEEIQQEIALSEFQNETEKGSLIAIKFNNIMILCLILAESFFKTKPISEKAIEIALFRILHDLTDDIQICLNENIYNDWYFGDVIPFNNRLLKRYDYDFTEETNKQTEVYTCLKYPIQDIKSDCVPLISQTISPQIILVEQLRFSSQDREVFLKSFNEFTILLLHQILTTKGSSIIQLMQNFKKENQSQSQSQKLKEKLNQLSKEFEMIIVKKRQELVQSILKEKRSLFQFLFDKNEANQVEEQINKIFQKLHINQSNELYQFIDDQQLKNQMRNFLHDIQQERKKIYSKFIGSILDIFEVDNKETKYSIEKINFKIFRDNKNLDDKVNYIYPTLDTQSKQRVDCNSLKIKATQFFIKDVFETNEKANIYIIEANDKTHICIIKNKATSCQIVKSFDSKDTNTAINFYDYNRNYLYIFNYKKKFVQQITLGISQENKLFLYQCFQNGSNKIDFNVSQVAYLNQQNQFIVLTEKGQIYAQQQQGQEFRPIQCVLDKDRISDYTEFKPSIKPENKYHQLLSCPSGKYFYLANSFCCDRYDQSCLRLQSIKIQGYIKIFADLSDVIILDQIDTLQNFSKQNEIHIINNLVTQKKFKKQQFGEEKVTGNPGLDIIKGSFSKFGPNAQFLIKGKKKSINLFIDPNYLKQIEPYFNSLNMGEAMLCAQQSELIEQNIELLKNIAFSRVPLQLCTIENGTIIPLYDGFRQKNSAYTTTSVDQKVKQLHLGFFEDHLLEKENKIFVVGIIGKQSSGKSYLLNRVFGTRFSVSSARCTDGVWASIAYVEDQTFVVLDCEGLFNGARTEKEEIKMLAFLTAVSDITILNSDLTFSRHLNDLFNNLVEASKQLNDDKLFKGILYIVLRDVSSQDNTGLDQELLRNLERLREGGSEEIVFLNKLFNNKLAVEKLFNNENKLFDEQLVQMRNYFLQNSIKSNRWKNGKELIQMMKILLCQLEFSDNTNASLIDLQIRIEMIFQSSEKQWYEFSLKDFEQENLKLKQSNYKFERFNENDYITFSKALLTNLYEDLQLQDTISTHNSNLLESINQFNIMMEYRKQQILQNAKSEISNIDNEEVQGMINKELSTLEIFLKDQIEQYQFCMEKCSECYLKCKHFKNHSDIYNKLQKKLQDAINELQEQFSKSTIKNSDQERQLNQRLKQIEEEIDKYNKILSELKDMENVLRIRQQQQEITNRMAQYDFYKINEHQINGKVFGIVDEEKETIELDINQIEKLKAQIANQVKIISNVKTKNIESIHTNQMDIQKFQNLQDETEKCLNGKELLLQQSNSNKEQLVNNMQQKIDQLKEIQNQIKVLNIQPYQDFQSQIKEYQFKMREESEKINLIQIEIDQQQNNWNQIQKQTLDLQNLSLFEFQQYFKQLRNIKEDLIVKNDQNDETQKSLKYQKVEIDELRKKLDIELKKKQTKDQQKIVDTTKQKLSKLQELNVDEQIKKYEKEKEDLQAKENEYDFSNMYLYEECLEKLQGNEEIQLEIQQNEQLSNLLSESGDSTNKLSQEKNEQTQGEKHLQNSENTCQILKIDQELQNEENDRVQQVEQKVKYQQANEIANLETEEIIKVKLQDSLNDLNQKNRIKNDQNEDYMNKINKEIKDLYFFKKQAELDNILQDVNSQKQNIKQIQTNIKIWDQQYQDMKNYLTLITIQEQLQTEVVNLNIKIKEYNNQIIQCEKEPQTLRQQIQNYQLQIEQLKGTNTQKSYRNTKIDEEIIQFNKRLDQLTTFQNFIIQYSTALQLLENYGKQFEDQEYFRILKDLSFQDVLNQIEEIEIKLKNLLQEQQESISYLEIYNQVERDAQKFQKLQNDLQYLSQQKLDVHSCLRESHKCDKVCQICPDQNCDNKAGHEQSQEHLCFKKDHRCNQICEVNDCKSVCMKSFKHDDKHNCQNDHPCKAKCNYCDKQCQNDSATPHEENHDCKDIYCIHSCSLCTRRCKDAHHKSKDTGDHFCDEKHYCQEKCEEKGICKIEYDIKEVTWNSSLSEFNYIKYIPKDIGKLKCNLEVPPGNLRHDGNHICKNETEKQFHICNQQCPECNTFCDLKYGHQGIHSSDRHRNKENQMFTIKEGNLLEIEIQDNKDTIRKYQIGENSAPETCDQSCKRRGKAHFHLVECKGELECLEKNKNFINKAKHSKEKYVNFETLNFDEVLCLDFWQLNNWAHPIYSEVNNIRRCNYYCPICFKQNKNFEFCQQEAWHTQDNQIKSHQFSCFEEHLENQIQGINIAFVLDTTGSMSSYIDMCKDSIQNIMEEAIAQKNLNGEVLDVSFAVVSYKDHDSPYIKRKQIVDIQDFASDKLVIEFLNKLTADGGGDGPEAVLDGLDASLRLNWTDNYVKLLYLIADAPPHGKQYHNFTDSFPEGCPCMLSQSKILKKLLVKKVQFKILQLNQSIDGMISQFKKDFPNLEVVDPNKEDKENQFQKLIVGEVCKYLAHNEITYQMRK